MELAGGGVARGPAWARARPSGRVLELGGTSPTAVPACPLPLGVFMIWRKLPSKAPAPGMLWWQTSRRTAGGKRWPLCSSDTSDSVCPTWHTSPWLTLQHPAPALGSELCLHYWHRRALPVLLLLWLMALLCTLLSRLVVTAVGCYPHNLLSWSSKLGSCHCFRITVSPQHFPNEGETPELSLWEWRRSPGHASQGPCPAWANHGANGRRCWA